MNFSQYQNFAHINIYNKPHPIYADYPNNGAFNFNRILFPDLCNEKRIIMININIDIPRPYY